MDTLIRRQRFGLRLLRERMPSLRAGSAAGFLLLGLCCVACQQMPNAAPEAFRPLTLPSETVTLDLEGTNGARWQSRFNIGMEANQINVLLDLHLVPVKGLDGSTIRTRQAAWETQIESMWSKRFACRCDDGHLYPIVVDVQFTPLNPHHRILVFPGTGVSRAFRWYLDNPPGTVAHETGHLFGAHDEYTGGATRHDAETLDPTSVMALPSADGVAYPRHLSSLLDWLEQRIGTTGQIVAWDEAITLERGSS